MKVGDLRLRDNRRSELGESLCRRSRGRSGKDIRRSVGDLECRLRRDSASDLLRLHVHRVRDEHVARERREDCEWSGVHEVDVPRFDGLELVH